MCALMEMSSGACGGAESGAWPRFGVFGRLLSKNDSLADWGPSENDLP